MSLPRFAVRQVVLVNLLFVILMVGGWLVARGIPLDVFPDISFNTAIVTTPWRGASAGEVERLVTTKLEEEIDGILGIKEFFSFSSAGLSSINIQWQETLSEIEYEAALNDLRAAIDRVDDLPEDAEEPILLELSVSEVYNICMVAVTDVAGVGEFAMREVAMDFRDRLERVPGLRKAELRGERDRELRVLVDRNRALQYDLTLAEIYAVVRGNNQNIPGGSFNNLYNQEITVRGLGNFVSAQTLSETVVKKNADGNHVRLRDLAEITDGFEKRVVSGRFNGFPTILIGVSKEADRDVIELVDAVKVVIAEFEPRLPPGIELTLTLDSSDYVAARIDLMTSNLLLGIALVVLILWMTLGFRNALLAIIGVPFSFLVAFLLFPIFGITINSLSLIGFIMVSGMLVDDAIIIVENIYRHIEAGEPLQEAVVRGAEEVMWPVIAAVTTTMAAFIPMLTIAGTSGEFMSILPKTTIVCLLGSLIEALLILPAHYLDWGSRKRPGTGDSRVESKFFLRRFSDQMRLRVDVGLDRLRDVYLSGQSRVLAHRNLFLAVSVAALFFACGVSTRVPVNLFPSDFNQLFITVQTPTDFGIDQTEEVMKAVERRLADLSDELVDYSGYVGMGMSADEVPIFGVNYAVLYATFPNTEANIANPDRVLNLVKASLEEYRADYPENFQGLIVSPPRNGPPVGKPVAVRVQADDYLLAKKVAEILKAELATFPGVYNIEDNVPIGPRELQVTLDEHRGSIHGLTFDDVGFALAAANDGVVPSTFKDPTDDEDIDIRIMLREEQRRSIGDLLDVDLRTPGGYLVKLGDVASIELERGFQRLYHYDGLRTVVVYADVDNIEATSTSVNQELQARFGNMSERYPGVNLIFGGEFQVTDDTMAAMRRAFLIALLAIYAILAAQFRSYLQPLVVMSVVFFSLIGVILGMFAMDNLSESGYPMSMYVIYAIVGLAGIVVNDSLVLIDFVNQERRRGTGVFEAVRLASFKRFRPILLTTVTTVAGLMPMALGLTGYSRVFGPFAAALVFGLSVASVLTLFVVPCLYLFTEDVTGLFRTRRSSAPADESAYALRARQIAP